MDSKPQQKMTMKLEPPDYIDERAKQEFASVVSHMGNKVQASDVYVIAEFAQSISDVISLQEIIALEGNTVTSDAGARKMNPNYAILMARRQNLMALMKSLGLTPAARGSKGPSKEANRMRDLL